MKIILVPIRQILVGFWLMVARQSFPPPETPSQGIGMVFQEQSLIGNLSVMENLFLGREQEFRSFGLIDFKKMADASQAQLAKVGLDIDPTIETSKLSFSQRQLIELAKVLTLEERIDGDLVILLDEPTSVLSEEEVGLLFELVNIIKGTCCIYLCLSPSG